MDLFLDANLKVVIVYRYLQKGLLDTFMSVVRMPRSAASRKSAAGRPEPDSEPEELLSGRFTQSQWTEMPEYEEAEEAVAEFMEILLDKVMDGCFRAVIRQQLCSYTTNWMKKHLVQIVEQHFLCRDEGDGAEEVLPEDSEPPPAETDAWAQGCVPIVIPSTPLRPISPKVWPQQQIFSWNNVRMFHLADMFHGKLFI
ncbi:hypothetical protein NL108_007075 [Boleophthalmus pectinirostris]|uniref:uncharacterized protein C2orf81 homolog n=1 Tax=Boleophthalmus pectinirostris TaxID=150288 RepID=UPI00242F7246|nr:uncharacterized protein C2orf81 homolog [Boleophthalmus pectinirostris]KAJ0065348.1 hypothetical protein NL108_007075 [Boleophthalmus pectinirostris]